MTVDAIHTATIQLLLSDGAARLTTTRVAARAGVSVGTLYQYYPHKQALLFALIEGHLTTVEEAMLAAVERLRGGDGAAIAEGLADAWLEAKTSDIDVSRALYAVAATFDIAALIERTGRRLRGAIAGLLAATPDARVADPETAAFMMVALLGGSVRSVMEAAADPADLARLRAELPRACRGYLATQHARA